MATFRTLTTRKARRCMDCGKAIKAGAKYVTARPAHPTYHNIAAAYCVPCADGMIATVKQ